MRIKKNSNFLESAIARVSVLDNNNPIDGLTFLINFFNEIRPGIEGCIAIHPTAK